MDPMPPPMLQPYDPTRGMISCFAENDHAGDNTIWTATAVALRDLLVDHYEEAFRRLPVDQVPVEVDLAKLVDYGGLSLGLLDPVTNIVLNTISFLPSGFENNPSSLTVPSSHRRGERNRDSWLTIAWTSSLCLVEFMHAYFGLLTREQAGRYLVWARADLAMAVLLVEHELYAARTAPPDPRSGRTRNSLRLAAKYVNHPSPDHLVSLATAWLPRERLKMLAPVLRHQGGGTNRLTMDAVKTILHAFRQQDDISAMTTLSPSVGPVIERTTSCADLGDGRIAYTTVTIIQRDGDHVVSLRRPQDMDSTLSSYSTHVTQPEQGTMKWPPQDSPCASVRSFYADAESCPYVRSLEMSLHGTIHGFYLRALAMLPSHVARHHIRGIVLAGHCYGPMDPVSNILLSAAWYNANYPLPDADYDTQVYDILDSLTILRAVSRSLRGLVALLHATSGQQLPLHEILKYLSYTQCDLSVMLQPHLHQDWSSPNPFAVAATAAKHPQAYHMAAFFASLAPTKLDQLRPLMMSATANNAPLSQESLTKIYSILTEETASSATMKPWQSPPPPPPRLCSMALSILASKRQAYDHQQTFIRGRIEKLLEEYARDHPSEPKYGLDFICCVALTSDNQYYHVNFMASSTESTLFFAEFWGGVSYPYGHSSKTSMCCPLSQPYDMGRCYYGRESARMIMYPDHSTDYFSSDIIRGGLDATEVTLETDFLYFDTERDVELARDLRRMAKQQESLQQSSFAGPVAQWGTHTAVC